MGKQPSRLAQNSCWVRLESPVPPCGKESDWVRQVYLGWTTTCLQLGAGLGNKPRRLAKNSCWASLKSPVLGTGLGGRPRVRPGAPLAPCPWACTERMVRGIAPAFPDLSGNACPLAPCSGSDVGSDDRSDAGHPLVGFLSHQVNRRNATNSAATRRQAAAAAATEWRGAADAPRITASRTSSSATGARAMGGRSARRG